MVSKGGIHWDLYLQACYYGNMIFTGVATCIVQHFNLLFSHKNMITICLTDRLNLIKPGV